MHDSRKKEKWPINYLKIVNKLYSHHSTIAKIKTRVKYHQGTDRKRNMTEGGDRVLMPLYIAESKQTDEELRQEWHIAASCDTTKKPTHKPGYNELVKD